MTRARLLTALLVLCSPAFATAALAQDQPADATQAASPEGGDMGGAAATGEATTPPPPADQPAAPPADSGGSASAAKPISVSLLLGYGISFESGSNPWGLGFGLRGGYNIDKIYIGPRFVYYLGASQNTGIGKVSVNIWELGLEGGYDVEAAKGFVVRPMLGLGIASLVTSVKITGIPGGIPGTVSGNSSTTKFFIAPGVAALYDVTDSFFLGADARFELIFASKTVKGLMLLANGGMRF